MDTVGRREIVRFLLATLANPKCLPRVIPSQIHDTLKVQGRSTSIKIISNIPGRDASLTTYVDGSSSTAPSSLSSRSNRIASIPTGRSGPSSMLCSVKCRRAPASLSRRWLVTSICPRASNLFERRQGSLTARICFDSVIDEHRPFGAPNSSISSR